MTEHAELRAQLEQRLAVLRARVEEIDDDLREKSDDDFEEQATEAEGDEVLESLGNVSRSEIEQILAAIKRIDEGEYGYCVTCGEAIAKPRLEALPYAAQCIDCAR